MAEFEDARHTAAQNELDENENPPSLNYSSSFRTVNDSFNTNNCEQEKNSYHPVSHNDDVFPAGLPTPKKNALVDSGFHCENLEKTVLPDLVNNSLCESANNDLANHETNEVCSANVSFRSNVDNSFISAQDSSFTVAANTTTSDIEFLLGCLTLKSEVNASEGNDLKNSPVLDSSALSDKVNRDNHIQPTTMSTEVSFNENFEHQNLPNVLNESNVSNSDDLDNSVSLDKSLQQSFTAPESIKVPLDETFTGPNPDVPLNNYDDSLESSTSKITNPDCPFNSEPSLNDTFKHPFPVPESTNVPNIQNISEENGLRVHPDDTINEEEFQDAVQFFKDPSSFQVFESINTSDSTCRSMPRDSLYMNFDPLYKRAVQPVSDIMDKKDDEYLVKEKILDGNAAENDQLSLASNISARKSLGGNLVSFDSPLKINSVENSENANRSQKTDEGENCSVDSGEDNQLINKQTSEVVVPESLGGNLVSFDSPFKNNSAGNSEKDSGTLKEDISCDKPLDSPKNNNSVENDNKDLSILSMEKEVKFDQTFDAIVKSDSAGNSEKENEILNEVSVKEGICELNDAENNREIVNKHVCNVPARESLGGNLLSFDSPVRSNSARNSENLKASLCKNNQKIYTEEEFQQAMKIYELTMQEAYLKKQRELEEKQKALELEALKKLKEVEEKQKAIEEESLKKLKEVEEKQIAMEEESLQKLKKMEEEISKRHQEMEEEIMKKQKEIGEDALKNEGDTAAKLHKVTELCKVLLETVSELAAITSEQNIKIGDLSARVICLESEKQKLDTDLKTSSEDLQSVEHTFSDFHKRYVQCKDMLKTYKDNEDRLMAQVDNLNKKLEEQEQMYSKLQTKMGEIVDKANAEVAAAKKGGDAQVAVLNAQLKKSELKVSSLESDLKQVRIENDKLSSICDDLMAKVSEA